MGEACSLSSNIENESDAMVDMSLFDDVDYFVVMACWHHLLLELPLHA
jgi:hypothetical protein